MNGLFAVVLTDNAPKDLLMWAVTDGTPVYLRCNLLEESLYGWVRLQVTDPENDLTRVTLLVPMQYVAFVMDGSVPKKLGFVQPTA